MDDKLLLLTLFCYQNIYSEEKNNSLEYLSSLKQNSEFQFDRLELIFSMNLLETYQQYHHLKNNFKNCLLYENIFKKDLKKQKILLKNSDGDQGFIAQFIFHHVLNHAYHHRLIDKPSHLFFSPTLEQGERRADAIANFLKKNDIDVKKNNLDLERIRHHLDLYFDSLFQEYQQKNVNKYSKKI